MNQNHDPNPYAGDEAGTINQTYDYDLNNIRYRPMSVEDWSQIPNNQSYYSQYWDNPSSFEPEQFVANTTSEKTYYDSKYSFLFFLNLGISIILLIYLSIHFEPQAFQKYLEDSNVNTSSSVKITTDQTKVSAETIYFRSLKIPIILSFFIGFVVNVIHFVYAHLFSRFYIKFGMIAGIGFSIIYSLLCLASGGFFQIVLSIGMAVFSVFWYFMVQSRISFSASIFQIGTKLIKENPSILFVCFVETLLTISINLGYIFICVCTSAMGYSPFWYVYCVFSYTWITLTISYVIYMTGCGLAASFYFLNGTPQYPKHAVWDSFKRSCTTSFGSACLAAFFVAVIEALKALIRLAEHQSREQRNDNNRNDNNNMARIVLIVLCCIAACILNVIESFVQWITRYALIYCSVFGVPYAEGCRRWAELEYTRFIGVLIDGCVIRDALNYNLIVIVAFSGLISHSISSFLFKTGSVSNVLFVSMTVIFTLVGLLLMNNPLNTMADTLLVCFAESPETLKENNNELYDILCRAYTNMLSARL